LRIKGFGIGVLVLQFRVKGLVFEVWGSVQGFVIAGECSEGTAAGGSAF